MLLCVITLITSMIFTITFKVPKNVMGLMAQMYFPVKSYIFKLPTPFKHQLCSSCQLFIAVKPKPF